MNSIAKINSQNTKVESVLRKVHGKTTLFERGWSILMAALKTFCGIYNILHHLDIKCTKCNPVNIRLNNSK